MGVGFLFTILLYHKFPPTFPGLEKHVQARSMRGGEEGANRLFLRGVTKPREQTFARPVRFGGHLAHLIKFCPQHTIVWLAHFTEKNIEAQREKITFLSSTANECGPQTSNPGLSGPPGWGALL